MRCRFSGSSLIACAATILVACGSDRDPDGVSAATGIGTLAYVVTECHDRPEGSYGRQRLEILRGSTGTAIVVKDLDAFGPLFPPSCTIAGQYRFGHDFVTAGVFQRLGVSPDGTRVVFEVTDAFAVVRALEPARPLPDEEKGIFVVNADGTGLRRLASPSQDAPFRAPGGVTSSLGTVLAFDPDGRAVVYTDIGPGPAGSNAIQVMLLTLEDGTRTQLTSLPVGPPLNEGRQPSTLSPYFLDAERVAFFSTANPHNLNPTQELTPFIVNRNGMDLRSGPRPDTPGAGSVVPEFAITGAEPSPALLSPFSGPRTGLNGFPVLEIFLVDGDNLLQLTNFGRDDITDAVFSGHGAEVFFNSSADPCTDGQYPRCSGSNPQHHCQIFSVDRTGGELRQLTRFGDGIASTMGCYYQPVGLGSPFHGCTSGFLVQDANGILVFYSTCAPFAPPDFLGAQIFAMRPDGSGMRQLTNTRGLFIDSDGLMTAELPGPLAYSSRTAHSLR